MGKFEAECVSKGRINKGKTILHGNWWKTTRNRNKYPNIANIAPNLMKTAPVLFTSNMTEKQNNGISKMN